MRRQKSEQGGSLAIKKDSDAQVWLQESILTTACILVAPLIGMCSVRGISRSPAAAQSIGSCFYLCKSLPEKLLAIYTKNFSENY